VLDSWTDEHCGYMYIDSLPSCAIKNCLYSRCFSFL